MPNEYVTTDDDDEVEVEGLVQPNGQSSQPQRTPVQKRRPRPAYRQATPSERAVGTDNESRLTDISEEREGEHGLPNGLGERDEEPHTPEPTGTQQTVKTPSPARSRKRSRPLSDDEDEGEPAEHSSPMAASAGAADADEIIVRRKRVRH